MTTETDVVIVGAGAAGLSAAKAFAEKGVEFTLLEGSHRIGGRAYSEEVAPGVWFDLGCSYLHQGHENQESLAHGQAPENQSFSRVLVYRPQGFHVAGAQ